MKKLFNKKPNKEVEFSTNLDIDELKNMEFLTNEDWENIKNQSYDYEFDWFGIDKLGQIAMFSSFNRGFRPKCVTKSLELYKELEEILESLARTTNAIKITKENSRLDDWIEYSEKGLFSHDLQDVHRTTEKKQFDILFKPEKPLTINELNLEKFSNIIPKFDFEFGTDLSFGKMENGLIN
ncbi:hypothetical protein [Psychroserpens ponticola]|uniref:Uncharacterized protein n=1 Tax=Psychroserpens ponticola TaxID=2932268 RepID=A0ABY7S2B7_9FLAO|nr:hypothetical protein [Psychroserpens ponticola]WCO03549.1 hypothetical protein MUN68_008580 [Psychroserpens ponticola]